MSSSTTGKFSSRPPPDSTKRSARRPKPRRPAAPATGAGTGPIRPLKKPPPAPTGVTCGYGICCHFGLTCVNLHSPGEVEFFTKRQDLRLQLREMALEIEGKKISHSRAKLASRKPLLDCTNQTAQPSSRGAAPAQAFEAAKETRLPSKEDTPAHCSCHTTDSASTPSVSYTPTPPPHHMQQPC